MAAILMIDDERAILELVKILTRYIASKIFKNNLLLKFCRVIT